MTIAKTRRQENKNAQTVVGLDFMVGATIKPAHAPAVEVRAMAL
jgi:hypothetical protein